jgi:uncharacterized Zn finger protein (UPF0148 family)
MDYKIKGIEGRKPSVTFLCTACNLKLHAPLSDAGSNTVCPTCSTPLQVPGTDELAKWQSWRGQEDRIRSMQAESQAAERQKKLHRKEQARLHEQTARESATSEPEAKQSGMHDLTWHAQINRWLAQAISMLNGALFIVFVVGSPLGGLIAGLTSPASSTAERVGMVVGGLIGGAIIGFVAGLLYCGFIALLINMSNNLQLLADERR